MTGEVQAYSDPPQLSSSNHAVTATTTNVAPSQSMVAGRRWCRISFRPRLHSTIATSPTGRLAQNTQRQDRWSVAHPPRIGPMMDDTAQAEAM